MVRQVYDEPAVAVFENGGSVCVRLRGTLDARMAWRVESHARADRTGVRLRLECSGLRMVEATGARLLAHALVEWTDAAEGRSVEILNLDGALRRRIAKHPLRSFLDLDEQPFLDPDRDPRWALVPSRH